MKKYRKLGSVTNHDGILTEIGLGGNERGNGGAISTRRSVVYA